MTSVVDVMDDDGFKPSQARDQEGLGTAWRKDLSFDAERGVGVMIWKADTGYYESAQPPYAETFVVLSGTADCSIGDAPFAPIGPGSIVHMPLGAGMRLRVKTPYRMVATAITGAARPDKTGSPQTPAADDRPLVSDWVVIDQNMISQFGELTLDPDPMHMDPEWAKANGPYGGTIAYGFLTISLLSHLVHLVRGDSGGPRTGYYLNYGFDRLRLVSPVRTGSRIRGRFLYKGRKPDEKGRILNRYDCSIEVEGQERPALVAEWLSLWVPNSA